MNNKQTAEHIRKWVANHTQHGIFSWPTDACGYRQHIKFVTHRNENWGLEYAKGTTFEQFCLDYADAIEKE